MIPYLKRIFFAIFVIPVLLLFPTKSFAQYIISAEFCLNVVNKECVEPIADGATVRINQIKPAADGRRIYYWANVRTPNKTPVAFAMLRDGPCYQDAISYPESKYRAHLSSTQTLWAYISNLSVGTILSTLNIQKVTGEVGLKVVTNVDAKLNVVVVPQSDGYRTWSWRLLSCAGAIHARLLDGNGQPLAGDNETKSLLLAD